MKLLAIANGDGRVELKSIARNDRYAGRDLDYSADAHMWRRS